MQKEVGTEGMLHSSFHDKQTSVVVSSTERCHNGDLVDYSFIEHSGNLCKEFIVSSPHFSIRKWLVLTMLFTVIGCSLQLHSQDPSLLISVIMVLFGVAVVRTQHKVTQESLLVIQSVGVQLTTTYASGRSTSVFYKMNEISDIVINEAITMHKVVHYLTLLIKTDIHHPPYRDSRLVPLFKHSWPSLKCLRQMYKGIHSVTDHVDAR